MNSVPSLDPPDTLNLERVKSSESISSSVYSPTTPGFAKREIYNSNSMNSALEMVSNFPGTTVVNTTAKLGKDDSIANLLMSDDEENTVVKSKSQSSMSIKTFSSNEEENYANGAANILDQDNEIFEHFNGSVKDLASPLKPKKNTSKSSSHQLLEVTEDKKQQTSSIKVSKTRGGDGEDAEDQFKLKLKLKNISRTITPVKEGSENYLSSLALSARIAELENSLKETETKYYKLKREIKCVDEMITQLEREDRQSVEYKKLEYGKLKLEERLITAKRDKYSIGIKLSKLRRALYGDNSGDMTEYFARNVSV